MSEQLQIFNNDRFGSIRTVVADDGEPRFCLSDVCKALELTSKGVAQRLGDGVISNYPIVDRLGRQQLASFVNEDGLYDVILESRKPEAKAFRKWVTSEVLPTIRKRGMYMTHDLMKSVSENPALLFDVVARSFKEEQIRRQDLEEENAKQLLLIAEQCEVISKQIETIGCLRIQAEWGEYVTSDETTMTSDEIASELGTTAVRLNFFLSKIGIIYRPKPKSKWRVSAEYRDKGLFEFSKYRKVSKEYVLTRFTQKGRQFVHDHIADHLEMFRDILRKGGLRGKQEPDEQPSLFIL